MLCFCNGKYSHLQSIPRWPSVSLPMAQSKAAMFALYRKVQDFDDDCEERQSLKAGADEQHDEPVSKQAGSSTLGQVPTPAQQRPQGLQHRIPSPATQALQPADLFDPFAKLASTSSQVSSPVPAAGTAPQPSPAAVPHQQSPGATVTPRVAPPESSQAAASPGTDAFHPFDDLLNASSAKSAPSPASPTSPAILSPSSTSFASAATSAAATTATTTAPRSNAPPAVHAAASDPCFIRESDWDLLAPTTSKPSAPSLVPAAPVGTVVPPSTSASAASFAALEDLFGDIAGASAPMPASLSSTPPAPQEPGAQDGGAAESAPGSSVEPSEAKAEGEAPGQFIEPRELLLYAIPLIRDRLVFLPVTAWQVDPEVEQQGFSGAVKTGFSKVTGSVVNWWNSMKEKDPETIGHKVYKHGQVILENLSAEERLMQNIPRNAQKLVVHHPAVVDPSEVQEQLEKMTATYCVKSVGKAAVAGVILPVAVGLEILAVPGAGWIALYHLYKSSVSAAGGQRLKSYLNKGSDVRVNFAGDPRLDKYVERVANSAEGVLTDEDIEELCHDVQESTLGHPLQELRNRFIRRHVKHNSEYAALPDTDNGADEEPQSLFLGRSGGGAEVGPSAAATAPK